MDAETANCKKNQSISTELNKGRLLPRGDDQQGKTHILCLTRKAYY